MSKLYEVVVYYQAQDSYLIDADSPEEAKAKAQSMFEKGIDPNDADVLNVEMTANPLDDYE